MPDWPNEGKAARFDVRSLHVGQALPGGVVPRAGAAAVPQAGQRGHGRLLYAAKCIAAGGRQVADQRVAVREHVGLEYVPGRHFQRRQAPHHIPERLGAERSRTTPSKSLNGG